MSYKAITDKIIDNFINEFEKRENIDKLKKKVIEPIIVDVLSLLYPYIILFIICIIILFIVIFVILFLLNNFHQFGQILTLSKGLDIKSQTSVNIKCQR